MFSFRIECDLWYQEWKNNPEKSDEFIETTCIEAHLVDSWFLQFDAPFSIDIKDRDEIMDEYFKQINRCSNNVRLDQGGPMKPHEIGHIFEDLAWLVMVDQLAIHFDDFQFRSSEFRDLAKVLKE